MPQTTPKKGTAADHRRRTSVSRLQELERQNHELESKNRELEIQLTALQQERAQWHLYEAASSRPTPEFMDFLENAAAALHWVGADGTILWANQAELDLLGYTREEYIGHPIAEFHVDQEVIDDILERLARAETLHEYEARLRCKDGSIKYVLISSNVRWEDDEFVHTRCFTLDITKQKQVEQALRESEARLRTMSNLVPSMVWTASPDGTITYANDRWFNYVGLTPEQNARQWPELVLHPDDRERCLTQWTQALQSGTEYEIEVRNRRYDGQYRWFLTRAVPIRNAEGDITAWFGTTTDIHDHKESERKLRESETELRLITDTVPGLIAQVDRDQRYQFVNAAFERWYNRPREQIVSRTIRELVGPERYEKIRPHAEEALAGKQVTYENTFDYPEGKKTVLATYVPYPDLEGKPSGFYALIMDISARKQMEEALRESEERFKTLANHAPVLIWINGPDSKAQFVNQGYIEFTGRPMKDLLGEEWVKLVHPADAESYFNGYQEAFKRRQRFEADFRFRRADGEFRWMKSVGLPRYQEDGIFLGYIGCTLDIHDHKQAEQAIQESEKRFRVMADTAPVLIWMSDPDKQFTYFNQPWLEFTGRSMAQELGFGWMEGVHPDDYQRCLDTYTTAFDARQPFEMEYRLRRADGAYRWIVDNGVPLFEGERFMGYIGSCIDIHKRKRAELAERLLAEAGEVLASSTDYTVRLSNVAHLAVPHLADWCTVTLFDEDWAVQHYTVAHIDPAKMALAQELQQRFPPRQEVLTQRAQPWQKGQAQLYPEISEAMLEESARDGEHFQILRDLHLHSAMVAPLMVQERVLGFMLFVWAESDNRYNEQDLPLAEELARRAAIALENARTYQAEQAARQTAEQIAERIASLQTVTTRLSQAITSAQIADIILTHGLSTIGINAGMIAMLSDEGTEFELLAFTGYSEQVMTRWQRFPARAGLPMGDVLHSGQPLYVSSRHMGEALYPAVFSETTHAAWAILPLVVEGRTIGGLSFSFPEAHEFSLEEREFGQTLAYQCAQALERARLYESEQKARAKAEAAQESIALLTEMRERHRLAQELHDNVAQILGYLNIKAGQIHHLFASNKLDNAEAHLQELKQVIGEAYTDIRGEIFNLRTTSSAEVKFLDMLLRYIDKYKRFYQLNIQLQLETDESHLDFPPEVATALIRTIQEALMNVRKHAQVDRALLQINREGQQIRIQIEDQGRGFDLSTDKEGSFGLKIMRERMEAIDGHLEIDSRVGEGTQITLFYSENTLR